MRQYFALESLEINSEYIFEEDKAHHIRDVLRMKNNDKIRLVDLNNQIFLAQLSFEEKQVSAKCLQKLEGNDSLNEIILCPALISKDKFELVIQKACELGASRIVPLITERTVIKIEGKDVEKKLARYNKIALEACQQCERSSIVTVEAPVKLKAISSYMSDNNYLCYERSDGKNLTAFLKEGSITILVGPEGGFSLKEVEYLNSIGFETVSLGKRILRAETASMYALSVIDGFRSDK